MVDWDAASAALSEVCNEGRAIEKRLEDKLALFLGAAAAANSLWVAIQTQHPKVLFPSHLFHLEHCGGLFGCRIYTRSQFLVN